MRTACSLNKENKDGGHGTNQSLQMQFKQLFLAFRSMDGHVTQYEKEASPNLKWSTDGTLSQGDVNPFK